MSTKTELPKPPSAWRSKAACKGVDPDLFYPEGWPWWDDDIVDEVKGVCDQCSVKAECLDYAIGSREAEGIFGGTTGADRRAIIRRMKKDGETVPRYGSMGLGDWL